MNILMMHQTVAMHDAIGNDIEAIYKLLNTRYHCRVYADNQFNKNIKYIDKDEFLEMIQLPDTIILYHHSVYWAEGYELLKKAKCKIIFRYHNITPPEFFANYNAFHEYQCAEGRKQTDIFVKEFKDAFWISDSEFNALDLQEVPKDKLAICAPFHKMDEWGKKVPDETILHTLIENDAINLLFVGRVVPNKGHQMLLDILRVFMINYSEKIKLRVIGKFDDGLAEYNRIIKNTIQEYGLEESIEFIGEINDSTLMAYYLGSDMLVCTSEHEGFCVPIIEAQYFGLPIIALRECAVPETIGQNQIVLDKYVEQFAAGIHVLANNQEYKQFLINNGLNNFESRFSIPILEDKFMKAFEKGV